MWSLVPPSPCSESHSGCPSPGPERMLAVFDEEVVQRLLHQLLDGAVLINSEPLQLTHGFRDLIENDGLFADAVGLLQLRHRDGILSWTGDGCNHGLSSLQLRKRRGLTHATYPRALPISLARLLPC